MQDILRSVLTTIITRAGSFIARNLQIATADCTCGNPPISGSSSSVMVTAVDAVGVLGSFTDGLPSLSVYPSARALPMQLANDYIHQ